MSFFFELRTVKVSLHVVAFAGARNFEPTILHPPVTFHVFAPAVL
jgi:hypothetical protein